MKHQFKQLGTAALALALGFIGLGAVDYATHSAPTTAQAQAEESTDVMNAKAWKAFGAHWQVGDSWTVETKISERATVNSRMGEMTPVQWKFTVVGLERHNNADYYKATIKCVSENVVKSPEMAIWVEKESGRLASVAYELKLDDKRTVAFQKTFKNGSVALAPITALPLDVVAFGNIDFSLAKSIDGGLDVEPSVIMDGGLDDDSPYTKDVGGQDKVKPFAYKPKFTFEAVDYAKTIDDKSYSGLREVSVSISCVDLRQLWAPNVPWPLESDNGVVQSTLIKYEPKEN